MDISDNDTCASSGQKAGVNIVSYLDGSNFLRRIPGVHVLACNKNMTNRNAPQEITAI